jgi:hypothetical protein
LNRESGSVGIIGIFELTRQLTASRLLKNL